MLHNAEIKKIEEFVSLRPRAVQEIASFLKISWRTADRYIEKIKQEFGSIETKVFREGTRGALKIVYAAPLEKISNNIFQEQLEEKIKQGRDKTDFSPFDIFQFVDDKKKNAWIKTGKDEAEAGRLEEYSELLNQAKKQILFFSGNLSFINLEDHKVNIFKVLEGLVKRGVLIKIVSRVDLAGISNVEKLLGLNFKYGIDAIEIHHMEQPLRATIIDDSLINLKEINEPTGKKKELDKKLYIFYTIKDKVWVEWISRLFWSLFSKSINAEHRLEQLKKIKNSKSI